MNKILFLVVGVFMILFLFNRNDKIIIGPGVMAPEVPLQEAVTSARSLVMNGYVITPLARFEIKAKVLSKENYSFGREADLSPVDLALGWGRMSDEAVVDSIDISQSGRWYRWQTDTFAIPQREIETRSANMHMIPKDKEANKALSRVRQGDIVSIRGYLVQAMADDGWHWMSSLSREDTGNGACELVLVESIQIETVQ